jgi:iron-sulfur cluster assembly protein
MLTISPAASAAITTVLSAPEVPDGAGVRLAPGRPRAEGIAIEFAVVEHPEPDDEVLDTGTGADVFLDHDVVDLLDDQVLDAEFQSDAVSFAIRPQSLNGHHQA